MNGHGVLLVQLTALSNHLCCGIWSADLRNRRGHWNPGEFSVHKQRTGVAMSESWRQTSSTPSVLERQMNGRLTEAVVTVKVLSQHSHGRIEGKHGVSGWGCPAPSCPVPFQRLMLSCRCVAGNGPKEQKKDALSPTRAASGKSITVQN
jgi:hypothetical protein